MLSNDPHLAGTSDGHAVSAAPSGASVAPRPARAWEGADFEINLRTLWRIVHLWRWLILGALAACLAGATIITLLTTPVYKSAATLEINPPTVEVLSKEDSPTATVPNDRTFVATQSGLLKSRSLAERVAQDLNLASNEALVSQDLDRADRQRAVVDTLMENLVVEEMDESRLLSIGYFSEDPQLAAKIVNGFAEGFIATSLERRYQASAYARNFLQNQIEKTRGELEVSERQLIDYAQRQGIISPEEKESVPEAGTLQRSELEQINEDFAKAQGARIAAEQQYRASLNGRVTTEQQQQTALLRNQRDQLEAEYQEKLQLFKPDYPELVQLRSQIDSLNRAIGATAGTVRAGRTGTLRADYEAAQAAEQALARRVAQLKGEVLNLRGRSVQYNILQREVDTNRSLYDALLQRYKEVGVAGGVGNSHASIVDRGDVPASPDKPNFLLNLLIGALVGLGAGLGLAFLLEFVSDTIKSPDDVRDRLGLAFLGAVPSVKGENVTEEIRDPASPIAEAYLSAATSLQFASDHGLPASILLSSTRPGEGKSTTSWALANQFANLGRKVLLIDGDMRRPTFITGSEKEGGLSTLLTSRASLASQVNASDVAGLSLLASGPLPPNPAELLASERLREILAEARERFDVVIVDGPPVLGLADSPVLSRQCEATLMVIEAGKTRSSAAIEALNRIHQAGSTVVGAILTRFRHEATSYGYNYDAYSYQNSQAKQRQIRAVGA